MQNMHDFMQLSKTTASAKRVAILGNSGSGKSTLALAMARSQRLALLDLDTVVWAPGQVAVARNPQTALADVRHFCRQSARWVVEGCYAGLVREALGSGVELVFLEPGEAVCLANCKQRPWEPHKYVSKAKQDEKLPFLLDWVSDYYQRDGDVSLSAHEALFEAYDGPKRRVSQRAELQLA